ncbi:PET domain protein [Ostertagia ostertagi]
MTEVSSIFAANRQIPWLIDVEEYMAQLPNHIVPRVNSSGEKYREKQLLTQLPRQDLSVAYCRHLGSNAERKVYEEFINARNEIALDIGYVAANIPKSMECHKCSGVLERNEMAVIAPKLGDSTGWHPACFTCAACEQKAKGVWQLRGRRAIVSAFPALSQFATFGSLVVDVVHMAVIIH